MKKALSLVITMCMVLSLFATFVISASAEATNVALNKEYTISGCGTNYAQYTASLTDGVAQANLTYDGNWFTFYCNGEDQSIINAPDHVGYVVIDLEGLYDVTSVKANCYDAKGVAGILGPKAIKVYLSEDGEKWSDAVSATIPALNAASNFSSEATVSGKARFVKFEMEIEGTFGFVNEIEVYGTKAAAPVEDKVINLLAEPGEVKATNLTYESNGETVNDDIVYTLDKNGFKVSHTGGQWPNATLEYTTPVTVAVEGTYLEIEATVTGDGYGAAIRLLGPIDDASVAASDAIYLHQFDKDVTLDGSGDAPVGSVISYKVPLSELAYCNYVKEENYAGKIPFTTDELTFKGLRVVVSGSGTVCTITKLNLIVPGTASDVIKETITVDGDLTDTGWLNDGWTVVNKDNGTYQGGIDSMKNEASKSFSYKFQMRTDETKLYVAAVYDCPIVELDGNGLGTKFRLWIHNGDESCIAYTHFYDIYMKDGQLVLAAKENFPTADKVNNASNIENSTLVGAMKEVDGKTYFEMSVEIAEFDGGDEFNYFFNAGFKTVDGENTDNIQMLYPAVDVPTEEGADKLMNFPYKKWAADNDAVVDVDAIALGERVVGGDTNDNLGDAGIYAIAALAVVALIGTAVVIKKRA